MKTRLAGICFLLVLPFLLNAQRVAFDNYGPVQGLSEGHVVYMFQDSKGFMWIGTYGGLNRFDGYSFKVYKSIEGDSLSIPNNTIHCIAEDANNDLWLGTNGGLIHFKRESEIFTSYTNDPQNPNSLAANEIRAISIDKNGIFYLGTFGGGLCIFNKENNQWSAYKHDSTNTKSFPSERNRVNDILISSKNQIWVASELGGLSLFNTTTKNFLNYIPDPDNPNSISDNLVNNLAEDKNGNIWVGTWRGGLNKFNPQTRTWANYMPEEGNPNSLPSPTIRAVTADSKNNLWLATFSGGVSKFHIPTEEFSTYKYSDHDPNSVGDNLLWSVYEDKTGVIWVGNFGAGISIYDIYKHKFPLYQSDAQSDNTLNSNKVSAIMEDHEGILWIATLGAGVNSYNRETGQYRSYINDEEKKYRLVRNLFEDSKNRVWFLTDDGIFKLEPDRETITYFMSGGTYGMIEDTSGTLWRATWSAGIFKLKKEMVNSMTSTYERVGTSGSLIDGKNYFQDDDNNMFGENILSCFYSSDFKIYATSQGGLSVYNPSEDRFEGLFSAPTTFVKELPDKKLYVGTNVIGLIIYDPLKKSIIDTLDIKDGLPGNNINDIVEDKYGNLWLGTTDGLAKYDPLDKTTELYDENDGLGQREVSLNSMKLLHDGNIVCGNNGFNIFDPKSIKNNEIAPNVVITNFKLFKDNISYDPTNKKGILKKAIVEAKEIKLNHKQNFFTFEFAALSYSTPSQNKYKYMLEGLDKDWNETDASLRQAFYTNVSPGKYTFKVIASNSDGIWNEIGTEIKITITPPFWKTIWFITLLTISVIFAVYKYIKYREIKTIREKHILEAKIKEGEAIVEKQRSEVEKQQEEIKQRDIREKEIKFLNNGLALFSEIISKNKSNLEVLCNKLAFELVQYIEAQLGAIYILNDSDTDNLFLELIGTYGVDKDKLDNSKVKIGEGYIGSSFEHAEEIVIQNIPENYTKIVSGLGGRIPNTIVIIPLKLDEIKLGVLELASFGEFANYKKEFLRKLVEHLTSILATAKANDAFKIMLQRSKVQSEEMQAQEEELRQNLEELQATQEEFTRLRDQWSKRENDLLNEIEELKKNNGNES